MSIDCRQLKDYVIKQVLGAFGLYTEDAAQLLLMTAATETNLGEFLVQKKIAYSGGISIYQIESPSYYFIWDKHVKPYATMRSSVKLYLGYDDRPHNYRLASDLALATLVARLYYLNVKEPLPSCNNIAAMAAYYKKYWNTDAGKNTVEKAEEDYRRLCLPFQGY